jgi:hypothetical protein
MAKKKFARECNACGKGMNEGYCIEGGIEYYCSKPCLNTEISDEEFAELYADGEGDSYWTDWSEDPDEYLDDEDEEDEVDTYAEIERLRQMVEDYKRLTETQDKIIALLKKQQEDNT